MAKPPKAPPGQPIRHVTAGRLLAIFLSECKRANPTIHVHGFMGAPGELPVDERTAADLARCIPGLSEREWADDIRRWIGGEQPESSDELVIRRYAEWAFRGRGIRIGRSGFTVEEERRAAEALEGIVRGRRPSARSCLDIPPGGQGQRGAAMSGEHDKGWVE